MFCNKTLEKQKKETNEKHKMAWANPSLDLGGERKRGGLLSMWRRRVEKKKKKGIKKKKEKKMDPE